MSCKHDTRCNFRSRDIRSATAEKNMLLANSCLQFYRTGVRAYLLYFLFVMLPIMSKIKMNIYFSNLSISSIYQKFLETSLKT